jgi:HEAT repeat protein
MIRVDAWVAGLPADEVRMLMQVHDELVRMATRKELPEILQLLRDVGQVVADDEPYSPRYALAEALPRLMGRKAFGLWREMLDDPEEGLRVLAVAGLCRLNDLDSLPQLREAARDVKHAGRRPEGCECPSQAGEISTGMNMGMRIEHGYSGSERELSLERETGA